MHACYNITNDKYLRHRVIQAFETANFIRVTSAGSDLSILAGDLNSDPSDICYKLISLGANMKDCYSMVIFLDLYWYKEHIGLFLWIFVYKVYYYQYSN